MDVTDDVDEGGRDGGRHAGRPSETHDLRLPRAPRRRPHGRGRVRRRRRPGHRAPRRPGTAPARCSPCRPGCRSRDPSTRRRPTGSCTGMAVDDGRAAPASKRRTARGRRAAGVRRRGDRRLGERPRHLPSPFYRAPRLRRRRPRLRGPCHRHPAPSHPARPRLTSRPRRRDGPPSALSRAVARSLKRLWKWVAGSTAVGFGAGAAPGCACVFGVVLVVVMRRG